MVSLLCIFGRLLRVVIINALSCLERLISKMTDCVSSAFYIPVTRSLLICNFYVTHSLSGLIYL